MSQCKALTLERHLSGLRSYHVDNDWDVAVFQSAHVRRMLAGVKRLFQSQKKKRLPLTFDLVEKITSLPVRTHIDANFRASYLIAFAGFLRSGEFCWDARHRQHEPTFQATKLQRRDIHFSENFDSLTLTLRSSKTDIDYHGVQVYIAATPESITTCPVTALRNLFSLDPRPPTAPLFSVDGAAFTRDRFVTDMRRRLQLCGIESPHNYAGHSARKGAAQHASDNGMLRDQIQSLGRWTSDAFKAYITIPTHQRVALNKQFQTGRTSAHDPAVPPLPLRQPFLGTGNTSFGRQASS